MTTGIDTIIEGPVGKLTVRSRGVSPDANAAVVLVQGALLSGQTAYDIPVGPADLSLLQVLADLGYAAVTFSIRGYGGSELPGSPLDVSTDAAITDLDAVIAWTLEQTGLTRVNLLGWSWGGRVAGRFVEQHPELVDRLVLLDAALGGTPPLVGADFQPWKQLTVEEYRNRVEPPFTEPDINELVAQYAAEVDTRAPMGVAQEAVAGAVPIVPEAVTRPTMMIYGEAAARADYMQGPVSREEFFGRLATPDKAFVVVPDGGDYLQFQRGRFGLHANLATFLAPSLTGAS